jgi:hypothetical protein
MLGLTLDDGLILADGLMLGLTDELGLIDAEATPTLVPVRTVNTPFNEVINVIPFVTSFSTAVVSPRFILPLTLIRVMAFPPYTR